MAEPSSYYDWEKRIIKKRGSKKLTEPTNIGISEEEFKDHMKQWRLLNL
ncbi:MAG: hypothetical protein BAJALOKI3v1_250026 [Promethearchaeota archaeon]|nr:MAG: hypothetical protein BAJALOKI3v1_250026 [Candidatus Lokiarchaeota archaeon]